MYRLAGMQPIRNTYFGEAMPTNDSDRSTPDDISTIEQPPTNVAGILQRLGPGLIIAGSIVGSGELIATTTTGAEAGFVLLWLILIGCVIKVFCQVELGRYTLVSGKTTLAAFGDIPGPRITRRANWLTAYWLVMFLVSLGQLGGIVGGVGQALQITWPLTSAGRAVNEQSKRENQYAVLQAELRTLHRTVDSDSKLQHRIDALELESEALGARILADRRSASVDSRGSQGSSAGNAPVDDALRIFDERVARLGPHPDRVFDAQDSEIKELSQSLREAFLALGKRQTYDPQIWAAIVTVVTAVLLVLGRYGFVQNFSTVLVASFTLVTIVNLCLLQFHPTWSVGLSDLAAGLSFRLPPSSDGSVSMKAVGTALAAFGIIGVGANELIQYPYWCVEKGYARFTGPHDDSESWAERARGWMNVMRWDAWCSMVVYTFATVAFYLLGAAILGRTGLVPSSSDMIRTLLVMYEPVFGRWAEWIFLFGAFAVLYSTFFVATAGHARVFPEGLQAFGIGPQTHAGYRRSVRVFSGLFPFICLMLFLFFPTQPVKLILMSGVMQGIMLPMLAGAAIYFRLRRGDPRIAPSRIWDICLWLSALGMLVTGTWTVWTELTKFFH